MAAELTGPARPSPLRGWEVPPPRSRRYPHRRRAAFRPAPPVVGIAVFNRPMLSQAEISDRLEIQQLLVDYSSAIDLRRFDDLDAVFTRDAYIDLQAPKGQ